MRLSRLLGLIILCLLAGCFRKPEFIDANAIPAPSDALAATTWNKEIVILGGDEHSRVVTIESTADGKVLRRFGVTAEAVSLVAVPGGSFYLGLKTLGGGAVEQWSGQGKRLRVIPMPGAVGAVTSTNDGAVWALTVSGDAVAAVSVPKRGTTPGRSIPLPLQVSSLEYCFGFSEPSFVISQEQNKISLVRLRDGNTTDTGVVGNSPACSQTHHAIYSLTTIGAGSFITVIPMSSLLKAKQFPTMREAIAVHAVPDGRLLVLGKGSATSAIRLYPADATDLNVER